MKRVVVILVSGFLVGCGGITPTGSEKHLRSFTQESARPYQEAYRIIDRRMRGCYRIIGTFGNGYDVQGELDTLNQRGVIEVFRIGISGEENHKNAAFGRTVTVAAAPGGSVITTTGTVQRHVYRTHKSISAWLDGSISCSSTSD